MDINLTSFGGTNINLSGASILDALPGLNCLMVDLEEAF